MAPNGIPNCKGPAAENNTLPSLLCKKRGRYLPTRPVTDVKRVSVVSRADSCWKSYIPDKMIRSDRATLLRALNPANKTCLNDEQMSDVCSVFANENQVPIIDSLWTTQSINSNNKERQAEYLERINRCIADRSVLTRMVLFPLFADEHWSLIVLFYRPLTDNWCYFHLDSATGTHTEVRTDVLSRLSTILNGGQPEAFPLSKKVPQQNDDWQCGHFVLMNGSMLLSFRHDDNRRDYESALSRHINGGLLSSSHRNIRIFARDIANLI